MKSATFYVGCSVAIAALIGFSYMWHASVWNECRATNSWLYCYHMVFVR
jgi:hypothetical protein